MSRHCSALLLILALSPALVAADDAAASALLQQVGSAPVLEAARKRVEAAQNRIGSAGRIADPEAEGMLTRGPGGQDMWEFNVRQPLPKRGEREADRDRARAAVALSAADYAVMAGELAAEVSAALAESEAAQARSRILEAQRARLDAVLKSIEARLGSAATTRIADRLTVQTRIAAMQLEIETAGRAATDALSESRGRLGLTPDDRLPAFAAPVVEDILVDEAPALNLALARVAESEAMARMAQASARPSTAVGLRFERERGSMGSEERVGIAFSSEIPWRSRGYARAERRAAQSEREAAQIEGTGARFRIASALSRVGRAERLAETARRLAKETGARLDAQYDALVRSAGAGSAAGGESTVLMAVEIFEQASETELKVIETEMAARVARAELWRYLPVSRFLPSSGEFSATRNTSPVPVEHVAGQEPGAASPERSGTEPDQQSLISQ